MKNKNTKSNESYIDFIKKNHSHPLTYNEYINNIQKQSKNEYEFSREHIHNYIAQQIKN